MAGRINPPNIYSAGLFILDKNLALERFHIYQPLGSGTGDQGIAQWATKLGGGDLKNVAWFAADAGGKAERGRAVIVTVDITRAAEGGVFKVMMLDVGERMGHIGLAGEEFARPQLLPVA
jgi:hypothetical protein